jgi:mono/diheme cytochrome c family protein
MATSTTPSRPAHSCPLSKCGFLVRALIAFLTCSLVAAPSAMAQSRGELLYTTHCVSCHTTEMHWRDKRSASNWPGLKVQVRRWQDAASLAWSDRDILDVSSYLNETIYHFEQTADPVSSSGRGINEPASTVTRIALLPRP